MRRFRLTAALALALVPATGSLLFAQGAPPAGPRVDVGVTAAVAGPDGEFDATRAVLAPHLRLHMSPRSSLAISGDLFTTRQEFNESWTEQRVVLATWERGLWQNERVRLSGFTGGGVGWSRSFTPAQTVAGPGGPITWPANFYSSTKPEFTLGLAAEQRVAPRLALRQDVGVILGEVSEFRAGVGLSVPIGSRYPDRFDPWTTRDGGQPDSLRNGTGIGAAVGAAVMTGFVAFLANALCDGDCENLGAAVAVGAAYGAGAGALSGAMIDSVIE